MELRAYWKIICSRKWILIVSVIVVPLFAYLIMMVSSPIYKSEAKLWVKLNTLEQKFFKDISDWVGKLEFTKIDGTNSLGTIEELLNNSQSIDRVITGLGLTNKKGEKITPDEFTNPYKILLMLHLREKGYREEQVTDSDVIKITGYSTTPAEANAIACRVLQELENTFNEIYKNAAASAEKTFLIRLHDINKQLDDASRELEHYRTAKKVYSITTQISTLMSEISTLESGRITALSNLQGAINDLENIKDATLIKQNDIQEAQVRIERSDLINSYKNQLLALETEQAKLAVETTGEHPNMKIISQQIELVRDKIKKEIVQSFSTQITGRDTLYDSLSTKYAMSVFIIIESKVNIKFIEKQLESKKIELGKLPEMERELNMLQWTVDNLKSKRDGLQVDYETVKSAKLLDLTNSFVFQPPTLFKNAKDNLFFPPKGKKAVVAVATCLGLFLGLFLVFFVEYWNSDAPEIVNSVKKFNLEDKAEQNG